MSSLRRTSPGQPDNAARDAQQEVGLPAVPLHSVEYGLPTHASLGPVSWLPAAQITGPSDAQIHARAREQASLGDALYRQGKFQPACDHYRQAVALRPADPSYQYKFACAAWRAGRVDEVRDALLEALRLDPRHIGSHDALGQWYLEAGNLPAALTHSSRAVELGPGDPGLLISHAFVLHGLRRQEEAWQLVEPLVARGEPSGRLGLLFGRMALQLEQEPRALAFVEQLLRSPAVPVPEKLALHFAASSLLDGAGRYDEAFEHARLGKEMTRQPYDPTDHSRRIDRRIRFFTPRKLHDLPRASHGNRRPVFIIGMPRSGTSLVEQILASHPQVHGAGELAALSEIARSTHAADWTDGDPYPENMDAISVRKANRLAARYLQAIARLDDTATYVTDKMPLNFMYLGLIQILFPDCHVIHCTRDPLDTCLSCYMTHFASGHEFAQDLSHLAAFYNDYRRLIAYWRDAVNVPVIEVNYEQVVRDLEGQTRRLLEFLDLPWDESCLRFFENQRPVFTASGEQVRRPLYASSVGRWKHYEKHLALLVEGLGPRS